MATNTKISCFLCSYFAGNSFSDVVRHIGSVHSHDPDFNITCGLDGCRKNYKKFGSYKVHLYRHHYDKLLPTKIPENIHKEDITTSDLSISQGELKLSSTDTILAFQSCMAILTGRLRRKYTQNSFYAIYFPLTNSKLFLERTYHESTRPLHSFREREWPCKTYYVYLFTYSTTLYHDTLV